MKFGVGHGVAGVHEGSGPDAPPGGLLLRPLGGLLGGLHPLQLRLFGLHFLRLFLPGLGGGLTGLLVLLVDDLAVSVPLGGLEDLHGVGVVLD